MPNYDYECDCGSKFEAFAEIAKRHETTCAKCGNAANLLISACQRASFRPYYSRTFKRWIGTEKEKTRLMRRDGLEEWSSTDEVKREAERMRRQEDETEQKRELPKGFVDKWNRLQAQS